MTVIRKGEGIQTIKKRFKKPGTVDVGIIDAGKHEDSDEMTVAAIAYIHEFGAEIDHPGGTPYIIVEGGKAQFVSKNSPAAVGAKVTKPHKIVIPERSFMRSTIKEKKKDIIALQRKLLVKIRKGEITVEKALGLIGEFTADAMSQRLVKLKSPPNKPATIRAKGGKSNPLVDTGQTKNSITYEVNR
jgi:hypothetical protein